MAGAPLESLYAWVGRHEAGEGRRKRVFPSSGPDGAPVQSHLLPISQQEGLPLFIGPSLIHSIVQSVLSSCCISNSWHPALTADTRQIRSAQHPELEKNALFSEERGVLTIGSYLCLPTPHSASTTNPALCPPTLAPHSGESHTGCPSAGLKEARGEPRPT